MAAPAGYPLPWCEQLDLPYWKVNMMLCGTVDGWRSWQAHKPMAEIIPKIDEKLAACSSKSDEAKR